jgi:REP element-mobilizing transposase RayT
MSYKKSLPKLEIPGKTYFVTFTTFERLELNPEARQLVLDACLFFDTQRYQLFTAVVMPDHVHLLIKPLKTKSPKRHKSNPLDKNSEHFLINEQDWEISEQDARTPHPSASGASRSLFPHSSEQDARTPHRREISEQDARTPHPSASGASRSLFPHSSEQDATLLEYWSLGSILHSIKGYSAKQIPKVMKHIGKVWQDGRYDDVIRNRQHFMNVWYYIRENPVEANLAARPEDYAFFWEKF